MKVLIWIYIIFCMINGTNTVEVSLNENVTAVIGDTNSTELICSFTKKEAESILTIYIAVKNSSSDVFVDIAVFGPSINSSLTHPNGQYLEGRVILSSVSVLSSEAKIIFVEPNCVDQSEYLCRITYLDTTNSQDIVKSEPVIMNINVVPSKPDSVTLLNSVTLTEGNNYTFQCFGNIGKPPGRYIWQKKIYSTSHYVTYPGSLTTTEYIPELCSYNGTSNLTATLMANDNQAIIRCVVNAMTEFEDMYKATPKLNVLFRVRKPSITKSPIQTIYEEGSHPITLTCQSDGNPKPTFQWHRKTSTDTDIYVLSRSNTYVIREVQTGNSGLYVCKVKNSIQGVDHEETVSENIVIVKKTGGDKSTTESVLNRQDTDSGNGRVIGGAIGGSFAIMTVLVISFIIWRRRKKNYSRRHNRYPTELCERHVRCDGPTDEIAPYNSGGMMPRLGNPKNVYITNNIYIANVPTPNSSDDVWRSRIMDI